MSIWCSWSNIGWDEGGVTHFGDGRVEDVPGHFERGEVRAFAEGFSNHYPSRDGEHELPASVDIAHIPRWCVPGHRDGPENYEQTGEWVRLSVFAPKARDWWQKDADGAPEQRPVSASVVLDVDAARQLAADLLAWADGEHLTARPVHPATSEGANT